MKNLVFNKVKNKETVKEQIHPISETPGLKTNHKF